jgi:thiamine biosynthesis protein ThiI
MTTPQRPESSVVIHYLELALKGRNRSWFVHTLVRTLRLALKGLDVREVRPESGRISVRLGPGADWTEVRDRIARLPGIANFARATHVAADVTAIGDVIVSQLAGRDPAASFRIAARRADKRFPMSSPDLERALGRRVQDAVGWRVDLERPALKIHVEVLTDDAFVSFEKERGAGGLPVGTGGRVLCLISGGIDSPVAAWRIMRRGCRARFVHFHSYPIVSRASIDKARELVALLTRHQLRSRLFLAPFGAVQQRVIISVPPPMRVIIYRRLMLRIAEKIADRAGADALVTGDVVGQVASQTLENLAVVGQASARLLLRPLAGFDKEEITREAQRIGTYDVSILPDEDCCSLFTPPQPVTRARLEMALAAEEGIDVEGLVAQALAGVTVEDFKYPVIDSAVAIDRRNSGDHT